MKILVYACNFTPDPIGVGKFTGEMSEWLAEQGHEVTAIVAAPFYPYWKVAGGYSAVRYTHEHVRGVRVLRCPVWIPNRQSGFHRMALYTSFAITSGLPLFFLAWRFKPDVVWTVMPAFSGLPLALVAARLSGASSWLHVQDFEVDVAFELGLLKAPTVRSALYELERRLLSAFDVVSSITEKMVERLIFKGITTETQLFQNWADVHTIYPLAGPSPLRAELGIGADMTIALYSGNLGEKQGVDDLITVARILADEPTFQIVICGDGVGRARLAALAVGLTNIRFLPVQPISRLNDLLNMADVHLLPQKREVADLVMPSKLGGMLASGRPIIAGANPNTQLAKEVTGCGIVVPPGDPGAMAEALRELKETPARRAELGIAAARRAQSRWKKASVLASFERQLTGLVRRRKDNAKC